MISTTITGTPPWPRLLGNEDDLAAYWTLDEIRHIEGLRVVQDKTLGHDGIARNAVIVSDNTLPLAGDAVITAEYST